MKHLKLYEEFDYDFELSSFISEDNVTDAFAKYGLACDNESYLTSIEIDDINLSISCMYSSYALDGKMPKNISQILDKICEELGADDWEFGTFHDTVIFSFDEDKIKAIDKYNL